MNDKEQWKPIPQFEELYEVSDNRVAMVGNNIDNDG